MRGGYCHTVAWVEISVYNERYWTVLICARVRQEAQSGDVNMRPHIRNLVRDRGLYLEVHVGVKTCEQCCVGKGGLGVNHLADDVCIYLPTN